MHDPWTIVTGAASGIGRCITQRFLREGRRVAAVDINGNALADCFDEYAALGDLEPYEVDIADETGVAEVVEGCASDGGINGLVCNAGIAAAGDPLTLPIEQWQRVLAVNLTGTFLCARLAALHLAVTSGAIVTIASTRALQSEPHSEAYAASKGGIVALTHALAASLAPVRVNCISPGWIATDNWRPRDLRREPQLSTEDEAQHLVGRVGEPEDVASAVSYLLGPESGFITGANLVIDGGMTRRMIYAE